jgi:histone chaperone ASF1
MLTGNYHDAEFIRIGYYVSSRFAEPLPVDANGEAILPTSVDPSKLIRMIAADQPRVTRFVVPWSSDTQAELLAFAAEEAAVDPSSMADNDDAMGGLDDEDDEEDDDEDEADMEIDLGE